MRIPKRVHIGAVVKETGLAVDTIRFYEKAGLLKGTSRSEGGFRLFRWEDIQRLKFAQNIRQLGFSLQETREMLLLLDAQGEACGGIRSLLEQKLSTIRHRIEDLRELETELKVALRSCTRELNLFGEPLEDRCPVLEVLGGPQTEWTN